MLHGIASAVKSSLLELYSKKIIRRKICICKDVYFLKCSLRIININITCSP